MGTLPSDLADREAHQSKQDMSCSKPVDCKQAGRRHAHRGGPGNENLVGYMVSMTTSQAAAEAEYRAESLSARWMYLIAEAQPWTVRQRGMEVASYVHHILALRYLVQ